MDKLSILKKTFAHVLQIICGGFVNNVNIICVNYKNILRRGDKTLSSIGNVNVSVYENCTNNSLNHGMNHGVKFGLLFYFALISTFCLTYQYIGIL